MATIFPTSPAPQVNDEYQGYRYNGTTWDIIGVDLTADYQPRVASVSNAELGYLDGVTSAIQTQLGAKAPLAALSPVGSVIAYALSTAPDGWLLCDGTVHNISSYPTLGAGLGSTYGGDGTTTFAVPNLKGRMPVGLDSTQTEFDTRGETGGSKTSVAPHTHGIDHNHAAFTSGDDSPDHSHGYDKGNWTNAGVYGSQVGVWDSTKYSFVSSGGASTRHQHNIDVPAFTGTSGAASAAATSGNLQPYIVMNYIIRAV
jgi:microcystin-dependent protein